MQQRKSNVKLRRNSSSHTNRFTTISTRKKNNKFLKTTNNDFIFAFTFSIKTVDLINMFPFGND